MNWLIKLAALWAAITGSAVAAAPELYLQPAYESPVRGAPDDLLMLPGSGFAASDVVVYRALRNATGPVSTPLGIPAQSTADFGVAAIVSAENVPISLTIKLPQLLRLDQTYALWVHTAHGEWSRPIMINDARPLWFTPAHLYAAGSIADLPRELKVIGRNLQPSPGSVTQVRLLGPQSFAAPAVSDSRSSETMDQHVARLRLPESLSPGRYRVQLSRDGASWIEVKDQTLTVLPNPPVSTRYAISDPQFGGCRPDDGADDTACILRAIAAAKGAGGGSVYFGPGTWDLIDSNQAGLVPREGIIVARGVQLEGAGSGKTYLARHPQWNARASTAAFTLLGDSSVTGFTFRDLQIYSPRDQAGPILQLGEDFQRVAADAKSGAAASVDNIVISRNTFDKPIAAIAASGLPINHLFVTFNTFGTYGIGLELGGNRFNMNYPYRIDDSVIDGNLFKAGSKLDIAAKSGPIASQIGAGQRLDFSDNTADGSSTEYLYSPQDTRGWRAAFFWNMNGSSEEVLVAQNTVTCSGDKIGDGEAISYDNNANTFAFAGVASVTRSSPTSVAVSAPLIARQNQRDVPLESYYVGHWIQVASGPGIAQVRKITGYSTDRQTHATVFNVAPAWDVIPVPGRTRIAVGREYWQVYTLDNRVDQRKPLCQKSNHSRHDGGVIGIWAQSADSVIEGNLQHDTDGILVQQNYVVAEHPCADCAMESFFQSFLDIRSNTVDGEYDWDIDCSASGIVAGVAAAPWGDGTPPTVSYGVSISHNAIRHADGARGGAIAQVTSWYAGPEPHRWPLSDNMLVHHNVISEINGSRATPICGTSVPRIGINFPDQPIAWHTVLYANSCSQVSEPPLSSGVETVRVCPSSAADSCECPQ